MHTVSVHAAKALLYRLVNEAAAGTEIIITKAGKPVAKLVPLTMPEAQVRRRLGMLAGQATLPPDFDAPLPDELLDAFEGR